MNKSILKTLVAALPLAVCLLRPYATSAAEPSLEASAAKYLKRIDVAHQPERIPESARLAATLSALQAVPSVPLKEVDLQLLRSAFQDGPARKAVLAPVDVLRDKLCSNIDRLDAKSIAASLTEMERREDEVLTAFYTQLLERLSDEARVRLDQLAPYSSRTTSYLYTDFDAFASERPTEFKAVIRRGCQPPEETAEPTAPSALAR